MVGCHRLRCGGTSPSATIHTSRVRASGALRATGKVGHDGHGEAARHHHEAVGGGGDEQADGERLRHEALRREGGRGAEADALLGDERLRRADSISSFSARRCASVRLEPS